MPRQNHIDMDGQTVPKGARFKLTGANGKTYSPMYPLDSILPPEESINCHCAVQEIASERALGMSLEERKKLQQKALDEMDDDWEKELNAKNRAAWEKRHKAAKDKKEFEEYSKILGKKNMPENLDEFQNLKYNKPKEWEQLKDYKKSVKIGELSPLSDFKHYKKVCKEINSKLVGVTTSNGIEIKSNSKHFISRVIGSVEQKRNGVPVDDIVQALNEPTSISTVKYASNGPSQKFILKGVCTVSVNPETGSLIQVNPMPVKKGR